MCADQDPKYFLCNELDKEIAIGWFEVAKIAKRQTYHDGEMNFEEFIREANEKFILIPTEQLPDFFAYDY